MAHPRNTAPLKKKSKWGLQWYLGKGNLEERLLYVGFNGQAPFPLFLAAISFCLKVAKS